MPGQDKLSPALWRLLALLVLSVIINYIDRGSLSTAAPLLKDELGLSPSQLGILFSSFFCTYSAFMVISGWLADRFEVNWVLAIGFFLWSAATVATGFVHGFAALFAARLVLGIGESVSYPSYSTLLARHFPDHRRGIANAALAAGMGIGPALGMFAGGTLMARFGWRPVFIGMGLIGLLWLPSWLKEMPRATPVALPHRKHMTPGILDILKQRSAWGTFAAHSCGCYLWYLLLTWIPFYLVRERLFSMGNMAKITGAAYLCTAVFAMISGWLSDRWISAGASPTLVRKTFVAVGLATSGICLLVCAWVGPATAVALVLLAFGCYGALTSNLFAITQTLAGPQASGKWTGVQNFFGSVSGILAPAVTGLIVNRTGHFLWAFTITTLIAVLGSMCWVFAVGPVKQIVWAGKVTARPITTVIEPA
jgi:MFS transporter, ACS family, D-galactonate transporter